MCPCSKVLGGERGRGKRRGKRERKEEGKEGEKRGGERGEKEEILCSKYLTIAFTVSSEKEFAQ
jgi:hypothetical protein